MLVLNKVLQQAIPSAYIKFNKVDYFQSSVISGLFAKKSNAKKLLKNHLTLLIRIAKSINKKVIKI